MSYELFNKTLKNVRYALIVRNERMTGRKMAGCVLGFAGVVVINLMGKSLDMGFTLTGEGFILISQVAYGISTILINIYSKKVNREGRVWC